MAGRPVPPEMRIVRHPVGRPAPYEGAFHKFSLKRPHRDVSEFAGRHDDRESGTLDVIGRIGSGLVGKRLRYHDPIADNGLASGARA